MIQLLKNKDVYGTGLFLLFVILLGYQQLIAPAIGVFILVVMLEGFLLKTLRFRWNKTTMLFVVLYAVYAFGLLWSEHQSIGWKLLEYKMSFFIFPVLFLFVKETTNAWNVLEGLIWGGMILAARFFYQHWYLDPLYVQELTFWYQFQPEHYTYQSIYLTIASIFMAVGWLTKKLNWPVYVLLPLILIFSYAVYEMASFAAILFLAIALAVGIGIWIRQKLKWIGLSVYIVLCPLIIWFTVTEIDRLQYDIEMTAAVYHELSEGKEAFFQKNIWEASGTKKRAILWLISAEIIAEHPMGVGTGDIDFALEKKCDKYGLMALKASGLNPHNQFLQVGIDVGMTGIIVLAALIAAFFIRAAKDRNLLLLFVTLSLAFNALFESVLQRQSGIVFYTLLLCLVMVYKDQFVSRKQPDLAVNLHQPGTS
jgi:O-antigen ligase